MSKTRAVAYVRVSTEKQADAGQSLEAQQAKLSAYASLYELELVEVVVDAGVSAKTLNRPGLQRALAMLESGAADALVVVKLDRLTRSVRDLGELVEGVFAEKGAALLSVSEQIDTRSAAGRLVLNVLASVSQWEREAIGERTAAVMQHKASQGEYTGGRAPYGFRVEAGSLVAVEAEQAVLTAARDAKRAGLTLRAIARELEQRGLLSRTGRSFAPTQVARMLA
jgi:site-specific DNA recombinase